MSLSSLRRYEMRKESCEVFFETVVQEFYPCLQEAMRPFHRPTHLLSLGHPAIDHMIDHRLRRRDEIRRPFIRSR
jgi:hypothetical protein